MNAMISYLSSRHGCPTGPLRNSPARSPRVAHRSQPVCQASGHWQSSRCAPCRRQAAQMVTVSSSRLLLIVEWHTQQQRGFEALPSFPPWKPHFLIFCLFSALPRGDFWSLEKTKFERVFKTQRSTTDIYLGKISQRYCVCRQYVLRIHHNNIKHFISRTGDCYCHHLVLEMFYTLLHHFWI